MLVKIIDPNKRVWGKAKFMAIGKRIQALAEDMVGEGSTPGAALQDLMSKLTERDNSRERLHA